MGDGLAKGYHRSTLRVGSMRALVAGCVCLCVCISALSAVVVAKSVALKLQDMCCYCTP